MTQLLVNNLRENQVEKSTDWKHYDNGDDGIKRNLNCSLYNKRIISCKEVLYISLSNQYSYIWNGTMIFSLNAFVCFVIRFLILINFVVFLGVGGVSIWCFFSFLLFFFVWLWIPLHFKILIVLINSWMSYKEPGNNCNCSFFLLFFNLISDYVIYNFMYTFKW